MKHHYFRPRNEKGELERPQKGKRLTYQEAFWHVWEDRGYIEKQIQKKWDEYQAGGRRGGKL